MTRRFASEGADSQPAMILVRPQMGENIGAAARAMWNFGLDRMRIVGPRDGWPNPRAVAMAAGAGRVLDEVTLHRTLPEAMADREYVFAATARRRELAKPVFAPEEAMRRARVMIADGRRIGILFGPERAGLENSEIARANAIVSAPVNPAFGSINLAQCVLLMAYEWRRQAGEVPSEDTKVVETEFAPAIDVEKLGNRYEERLEEAGFFFPEARAGSMKTNLRNMWSRMPLTRADVRIFHGILRQLVRWKEGG